MPLRPASPVGAPAFTCPRCTENYRPHWLEPDGSGLCRSCAAERDDSCAGGHSDHPCSGPQEKAGGPCRYCGRPVARDGAPCPDCTISLDGMPVADIKALFAGDPQFTIGGLAGGGP
jgi:hypothetical protein